jgi:predicted PurR-regulated permease PerM
VAPTRRTILFGVLGATVAIAALFLSRVIGTVVLGVAAAYVLLPVHRWFLSRGVPPYWSAIISTGMLVVIGSALIFPVVIVLWVQWDQISDILTGETFHQSITVAGREFDLSFTEVQEIFLPNVDELAVSLATDATVYGAQAVVFAFVIFALLYYHNRLRPLAYAPLPDPYHDVVNAIHVRVKEVLYGHYVLAVIGATVTYVAGIFVFGLLGYSLPFVFALTAALFWILPFLVPSVFVFGLGAYHALVGDLLLAGLIVVIGSIFLIALPRLVVAEFRERLGDPRPLSSTVYFIGFVGGALTIGFYGIVIGPLALAVLGVALELLADDTNGETPT